MTQLKFTFSVLTLLVLSQFRVTESTLGCTVNPEKPGEVHGPAHWGNSWFQCWYIGPTDVTCSGNCGGDSTTTIPQPQNLASRVDVCSCCHTEIVLVTEQMFYCEFQLSGSDPIPRRYMGNYYSFEECSCDPTQRRRKRDENQRTETQRGHHCQELRNTIFTSECQSPEDPVTVCWSKTRPVFSNPFEIYMARTQMRSRMRSEESGFVILESRKIRNVGYTPTSWDFPDEIFRTDTTRCCKAHKDPDCMNVNLGQCARYSPDIPHIVAPPEISDMVAPPEIPINA